MIRSLLPYLTMSIPKRIPIPPRGVDYRGKVVLAPMVRSGELPCRLLALHYGADLVWGPETIDKAMIGTTRRVNPRTGTIDFTRMPSNPQSTKTSESVIYRLHPTDEQGKLVFQLGTAGPVHAVQAAKLVAQDVAGIDVNSGCPKPFSTSGGMGAALLKDPERLASILEALVTEVGLPYEIGISVKIRLLETPEQTHALVTRLVKTGITGLTVHCRTTPMRPREPAIRAQLRMIADICREAGVACVMNGDVPDREQALELVKEYGVDGAMLATAAEANPSVFRPDGVLPWRDVAEEYMRTALRVENKWPNTKFSLSQLIPGKSDEGRRMQHVKNFAQMVTILGLANELGARAAEVDALFGIAGRADVTTAKAEQHHGLKARDTQNDAAKATTEKKHGSSNGVVQEDQPPAKKARHVEEPTLMPAALSV
jgi:tRNA-dihydrouridine synthase 2